VAETPQSLSLHASAVAWHGQGILVRGQSGSGKSRLVLHLLAAGAYLVADDLVLVRRVSDRLWGGAVRAPGLIEARGLGIFRVAAAPGAWLALVVDMMSEQKGERLPEIRTETILGLRLPATALDASAVDLPARLLLALFARRTA
jgi:HPr kinase/phosphorylase